MDLANCVADWSPEATTTTDDLDVRRVDEFAATLDLDGRFQTGDALPLLWQWIFFLDWPPTAALGADGHPRDGHFLPPIPNRRRMFAGGRVSSTAPLRIGHRATRQSEITGTTVKTGRTGEMLFVTVRHTYTQDGTVALVEEQDLVYRSDAGTSTSFARVNAPLAVPRTGWFAAPTTHPALLFRFSALTGNAHRIHYDEAYTTAVEGFPALVVHGPLLAIYLAELVRANAGDRAVTDFTYQLRRPVFVGDEIGVTGVPAGSSATLSIVTAGGDVHASATATF